MRYQPTPKTKLKKSVLPQVSPFQLAQDVGSISLLVQELRLLREDIIATANKELERVDEKLNEVDQKMEYVLDIKQGPRGIDADEQKIADWVLSQIYKPKDGKDGKDADEEKIVARIAKMVPKSDDIAKDVLKRIPENKASLKVIQEKIEIDQDVLMGHLERLAPELKKKFGIDDMDKMIKILDRRYIHGGGDTVSAGTGITITNVNGTKQISATGSSFTILAATGTIDDSNTTFTFASAPSIVVINGAAYSSTSTVGGTLAWTLVGLTVTTAFPVGTGGSIFGMA